MQEHARGMERLTVSLPISLTKEMETLTKEFGVSKSEVARRAFEQYIQQYRRQKLHQIAEAMVEEYQNNPELTVFTNLDSEAFK